MSRPDPDPYRVPEADLVEPAAAPPRPVEPPLGVLRGVALAMSLVAFATTNPASGPGLLRLVATAGLALMVAQGRRAARWTAVVLYGLGGLVSLTSAVPLGTHQHYALFGLGCAYSVMALVLAFPAQVQELVSGAPRG